MSDVQTIHLCTKNNPWTPEKGSRSIHPDAQHVEDRDYGAGENCACYRCPHCGKYFEEEVPQ